MFWALLFIAMGGLSVLTLTPTPILGCAIVWAIARPVEKPQQEIIRAAGRNPEAPPMPTSGIGALGCLMWLLCMGVAGLLCLAVVGAALTGGA